MHGAGKSDRPVVPGKPPNKATGAPVAAEEVEERGRAKGSLLQQSRNRTQSREILQGRLRWTRQAAALARYYLRQEPSAVVLHAGICAGAGG